MRRSILGVAGLVIMTFALTLISWKPIYRDPAQIKDLYDTVGLAESGLSLLVFEKAVTGFYNLKNAGKLSEIKSILSIADFDQSSTKKRLWIIDLNKKELLLNTWVAHGELSGGDKASYFSNTSESLKSSIGFYVTGETYYGKHGLSLKLDGMDEGFNSNARKRSIVVHGASYVSQETIDVLGRLGRSQGCPAVPRELANMVVGTMQGKTALFINVTTQNYSSIYLEASPNTVLASN
jgi:hypothetical protein